MTWEVGSITSTTPASALRDKIEQLLTAHGNWSLADDVTIGSIRYRIWYRNHAQYPFYVILYVVFNNETASGAFRIGCSEEYNAATDQAIRPVTADINPANVAADGSKGNGTGYNLNDTAIKYAPAAALPASGYSYAIQVRNDHLYVAAWTSGLVANLYAGLFNPYFPTNDPYPLVLLDSLNNDVRFSRQVGTPPSTNAWVGSASFEATNNLARPGSMQTWPTNPNIGITRAQVHATVRNFENNSNVGVPRGVLYDIMGSSPSTGYVTNDRLSVGGVEKYVVIAGGSPLPTIAMQEV